MRPPIDLPASTICEGAQPVSSAWANTVRQVSSSTGCDEGGQDGAPAPAANPQEHRYRDSAGLAGDGQVSRLDAAAASVRGAQEVRQRVARWA
jgi:hypothetical protein